MCLVLKNTISVVQKSHGILVTPQVSEPNTLKCLIIKKLSIDDNACAINTTNEKKIGVLFITIYIPLRLIPIRIQIIIF